MAGVERDVVLGGRYRLLHRIAAGGMGTVWEAEDTLLHRRVAVKLLSEALGADPTFVERFRREARAAAGLSHPNVAGVFDYGDGGPGAANGDGGGVPFIVMELIPGQTLAARLAEDGPLDPAEAAGISSAVARALQAAHDAAIVHRDVKPGNVMMTPGGDVKVMDFGIAAAASEAPLTTTGVALGTAAYISPEQASGGRATAASDVYSLGCVLYELLTGRPPFDARGPVALAAAHAREEPTPVRALAPEVPPWLAQACERALAKDPRDRPASAAEFAAMLSPANGSNGPNGHGHGGEADREAAPTAVLAAPGPTLPLDEDAATRTAPLPIPTPPVRPPTTPGRRSRLPAVLAVVAAALVLAALGGLGAYLATHAGAPPTRRTGPAVSPSPTQPASAAPSPVAVPRVVGLPVAEAVQRLDALGIEVGAVRSARGPRGEVVRVDPSQGSTLSSGQSVTLYVGTGQTGGGQGGDHGHGKRRGKDERKKG